MKVATCSIIRLENQYLTEFVEHYKGLGVDHMFIYDNNMPGTENPINVLKSYVNEGFVTIVDYTNQELHPMGKALIDCFTECYNNNKNEYDWILFLDNDELLMLQKDNSIKEYLGRSVFDNVDIIRVNWLCYDDNGLVHYDNRPMKERFRRPCNGNPYLFGENLHIKSIINCNNAKYKDINFNWHFTAHSPKYDTSLYIVNNAGKLIKYKKFIKSDDINYDLAYYAHYRMKTMEEYISNKIAKLTNQGYNKIFFSSKIFFKYNQHTPYKEQLYIDNICRNSRNVVYTVITGDYDELVDPEYVTPGWTYVCFTTNPYLKSDIWNICEIKESFMETMRTFNKNGNWRNEMQYANRYIKFLVPNLLCAKYDFSIYIDGNVRITGDLNEFKKKFIDIPGSHKYALWTLGHYKRNCMYEEIDECIKQDKDYKQNLENLKKKYEEEEVPHNLGMSQNAIICRYHNDQDTKILCSTMWRLISTFTVRDQCLLYYALYKYNMLDSICHLFDKLHAQYFKIIDNIHKK